MGGVLLFFNIVIAVMLDSYISSVSDSHDGMPKVMIFDGAPLGLNHQYEAVVQEHSGSLVHEAVVPSKKHSDFYEHVSIATTSSGSGELNEDPDLHSNDEQSSLLRRKNPDMDSL